jgi:hypothetical protein
MGGSFQGSRIVGALIAGARIGRAEGAGKARKAGA